MGLSAEPDLLRRPTWIPDVMLVTTHLLERCKSNGWPCEVDVPTIAKALKITQRRVEGALGDMAEFGITDVDGYTDTLRRQCHDRLRGVNSSTS
jgi:hypothetical protein